MCVYLHHQLLAYLLVLRRALKALLLDLVLRRINRCEPVFILKLQHFHHLAQIRRLSCCSLLVDLHESPQVLDAAAIASQC